MNVSKFVCIREKQAEDGNRIFYNDGEILISDNLVTKINKNIRNLNDFRDSVISA